MTAQILDFPIIPRKPADRELHTYRCIQCGDEMVWPCRFRGAIYCEHDGAEMRPVEGK